QERCEWQHDVLLGKKLFETVLPRHDRGAARITRYRPAGDGLSCSELKRPFKRSSKAVRIRLTGQIIMLAFPSQNKGARVLRSWRVGRKNRPGRGARRSSLFRSTESRSRPPSRRTRR